MVLNNGVCTCRDDYTLEKDKCVLNDSSNSWIQFTLIVNAAFMVVMLLLILSSRIKKHYIQIIDIGQIVSLMLFIESPNFYNQKDILLNNRYDNFAPLFRFYTISSDKLDISDQTPAKGFLSDPKLTSNLLVNIVPLATFYAVILLASLIVNLLIKKTVYPFVDKLKQIYPWKIFILAFILTGQEEFMLLVL